MKISSARLKRLCRKKGLSLNQLLQEAGVSKNAYYYLARKDTVLPNSIIAIAGRLGVKPSSFMDEASLEADRFASLLEELERVLNRHKQADRENVRHTLLLLQEEPIERLRRSLTRGQRLDFHGSGG
jgi:transcriptional regulator with XRE-family HTH domain